MPQDFSNDDGGRGGREDEAMQGMSTLKKKKTLPLNNAGMRNR